MSTVVQEVKYQVLKKIEIQEMVEPGVPVVMDGQFVMTTYERGDILPEGTVSQWGDQSLRRMVNNEQVISIGKWGEGQTSGRGSKPVPAPRLKALAEEALDN